tara:strand:- start:6203 stop:6418 length:216 start_codon:yes stop_codon:yes gene_type:complete
MFDIDEFNKPEEIRELILWLETTKLEEVNDFIKNYYDEDPLTEEEIEGTIQDYELILKKAEDFEYAEKLWN